MRRLLITLLMLLAFSANAEIRLYEVAKGQEAQISEALTAVLSLPDERGNPSGVIELLPGGQLLVNTTPELHADIEALIAALKDTPYVAERNYRIRFWILFVPDSPDAEFSRESPLDEPMLSQALQQQYAGREPLVLINASAESVANRNANLRLLQGHISYRLRSGHSGLSIETEASLRPREGNPDRTDMWDLASAANWNNVQALLQPDEYLVLAETNQILEQQPGRLLLVIQWDESGS